MASSSSSNTISQAKHDVFISFRGVDVRDTFLSHLKAALDRKQIQTFIDDKLDRGEEISSALLQAIEESTTSVIIFSENYADSPWCLDELLHIFHCRNTKGQFVLPVFYRVDPTHVEEQIGSCGDAFQRLKKQFKKNTDRVQRWSSALKEAANISGLDWKNFRSEANLIEKIANDILEKVRSRSAAVAKGLVGIYSHVEKVKSLLRMESPEILFVGILGMGGMGKTTTAEVLYCEISSCFDGCCFIRNVREESEKHDLSYILQRILSTVLQDKNLQIQTINALPTFIIDRLRRKKVLIVLDDVSDIDHLKLTGNHEWFGSGSRVILTGRNRRFMNEVDEIYEIKELPDCEAFELFCLKAFKRNKPLDGDYEWLSRKIVDYAKGVPLALNVLGSLLCRKEKKEWESKLKELEKSQEIEIQKVLKTSYDALDENEKKIFLDIACFFRGEDNDLLKGMLDGCGFFASYKISSLVDKCLITIVENKVEMHDLMQELGWTIVRQESKYFGKRSRLWDLEEIIQLFTSNTGTPAIEGMSLNVYGKNIELSTETFSMMNNLRLLKVYGTELSSLWLKGLDRRISWGSNLRFLPNTLSYLYWKDYPWKSLPPNFSMEKLVSLTILNSELEELWSEEQSPHQLKHLNLSKSCRLTKLQNLSFATSLERIILDGCGSLEEIPSSIQQLHNLNYLSLKYCRSIKSIPSLINMKSLKYLNLDVCLNLEKLSDIPENIEYLDLSYCEKLTSLPSTLHFNFLEELTISSVNLKMFPEIFGINLKSLCIANPGIEELSSSIGFLSSLVDLRINNCVNLKKFPEIKELNPKDLSLAYTGIEELPSSIGYMSSLLRLNLEGNKKLETLPSSICQLTNLEDLNLQNCKVLEMPCEIGNLSSLKKLILRGNNLKRLPESIKQISTLRELDVSNCKRLVYLPEISSSISYIKAAGCILLETTSLCQGQQLYHDEPTLKHRFDFWNCVRLDANSRNNIVANMRCRIQDMARKLLRLFNENHHKSEWHQLLVFLPRCIENPEWFECQNKSGSSIIIQKQSHDWSKSDGNYAGLTFFVLIEDLRHVTIRCKCCFKINDSYSVRHISVLNNGFGGSLVIWYENILDGKTWCNIKEASFEFEAFKPGLLLPSELELYKVEKCGVHVVYTQDETQLINYTSVEPHQREEAMKSGLAVAYGGHGQRGKKGRGGTPRKEDLLATEGSDNIAMKVDEC